MLRHYARVKYHDFGSAIDDRSIQEGKERPGDVLKYPVGVLLGLTGDIRELHYSNHYVIIIVCMDYTVSSLSIVANKRPVPVSNGHQGQLRATQHMMPPSGATSITPSV